MVNQMLLFDSYTNITVQYSAYFENTFWNNGLDKDNKVVYVHVQCRSGKVMFLPTVLHTDVHPPPPPLQPKQSKTNKQISRSKYKHLNEDEVNRYIVHYIPDSPMWTKQHNK